ncbi:MAG: transcription antitermination factor NusB [Planctomycetota bacterium]
MSTSRQGPRPRSARSARPAGAGIDPRTFAIELLGRHEDGRLALIADGLAAAPKALAGRDRALARELALGALRHRRLYDCLYERHLRPGPQPHLFRHALRIGAHQLYALDRIPVHAAVGETVAALRRAGGERFVGVANAVLRRLAERRQTQRQQPGPLGRIAVADRPGDLAVRHSLPDALLHDLALEPGPEGERRLAAFDVVAPLCTRLRPGRELPARPVPVRCEGPYAWWSDPAMVLRELVGPGICRVQDRAQAEAMVRALAGVPAGARVLDACAAPGGKALWLHDHGYRVVACDRQAERCAALRRGLPEDVEVVEQDARHPVVDDRFDVVVADVPCSNTGVIARRPEARWRYDAAHLASLGELQRAILRALAPLVAPGGRLIYATCSVVARENHAVASSLPGWRIVDEHTAWPDTWQGGGYMASLERVVS